MGYLPGLVVVVNPSGLDSGPLTVFRRNVAAVCCGANMAHIRQSRPDYGVGSYTKVVEIICVVLASLGSGPHPLDVPIS